MTMHVHDVTPIGIDGTPKLTPSFTIHRVIKRPDEGLPPHVHGEAQLTFAAAGMVQVETSQGVWLVPPQLAAWIPPDVRHSLDIVTEAELWMILVHPTALVEWGFDRLLDRAFALRVTPLLRAALKEAVAIDPDLPKAELLVRLMMHELTAMPDAPTFLPMPSSQIGRRVADVLLLDGRCELGLSEIASRAATSVRTASRLFPTETGLTILSLIHI